jgi:RNA polymerase sigma-70 factor (ECF subfamily)
MFAVNADEDAPLVARAREGDERAFAELLSPYRRGLWGVCLRVTGNAADAEDALQDTMISAWRHLGKFRGDARFSTWVYRIAVNASLATVRRRRDAVELSDEVPETRRSFTGDIADRDQIQRALVTLPESFRVALVLREYGGFTYAEIATHQGILIETVKTRLHRARLLMQAALNSES